MITLKSPPALAIKVLHMNCYSSSPGGKDYVLVRLANGQLWGCNGPAGTIRNGGGAEQRPSAWDKMVNDKLRKGYEVVGEYFNGTWYSRQGETYKDVLNIPVTPSSPQSSPEPEPLPAVAPRPPKCLDLSEKYPVSDLAKEWGPERSTEWFAVF